MKTLAKRFVRLKNKRRPVRRQMILASKEVWKFWADLRIMKKLYMTYLLDQTTWKKWISNVSTFFAETQFPHVSNLLHISPYIFSVKKTYHRAQECFLWPWKNCDVQNWVDSCDHCLKENNAWKTDLVWQLGSLPSIFGNYRCTWWDHWLFLRGVSTFSWSATVGKWC